MIASRYRKLLALKVPEARVPEVIRLQLRATILRRARPAVAAAAVPITTIAAGIMTAARNIQTTTAAGAVAMTAMSATTKVVVAAVTNHRRGAQARIRHQELMAATLALAARWKATAAQTGAIGLSKLKTAKQ